MTLRSHLRIGSLLWLGLLLVCFNVYYYQDVGAKWSDPHGIGWAPEWWPPHWVHRLPIARLSWP